MKTANRERRVITLEWPPRGDELVTPWGPVGGPPRELWSGTEAHPHRETVGMDPVFLTTPDVVGASCCPDGWEHEGIVSTVSPAGLMTLTSATGSWVYELFPAEWSDGAVPTVYLAVWPD
ncbi:hypothetical protein H7J86_26260 [Mycobacterium hackensackense]|uniref:hypothetical protein n=1 Tax=Mycobacterium hackensackense TaxID=228909 RepID=UPI002265C80B|nr:hypothetical protein [Mycobacterium hackensackense]MCV7255673.1 hypothetical protein [Mycobacterium hackensackense]